MGKEDFEKAGPFLIQVKSEIENQSQK